MNFEQKMATASALAASLPDHYDGAQLNSDLRRLFYGSNQGMRVLAAILMQCNIFELSYVEGDTHAMAKNEGMRELGLWLMDALEVPPPDEIVKRLSEIEDENT